MTSHDDLTNNKKISYLVGTCEHEPRDIIISKMTFMASNTTTKTQRGLLSTDHSSLAPGAGYE